MASYNWDRFYESYFGDPYTAWHDGLDTEALLALEGDEKERAEKMLIDALDTNDYRPAAGLAALRSEKAAGKLKERLPETYGSAEVQTALALWQIEKYLPAANTLVRILQTADESSTRMEAARALRYVPIPRVLDTLWRSAEHDPDSLVRSQCAESLIDMHNIDYDFYERDSLNVRAMSEDRAERKKAIMEMRALIKREGYLGED